MTYEDKTIYRCIHCGEQVGKGAKYCPECRTANGRREQDEANNKIRAEAGLAPLICKLCQTQQS